MRRTVLSSGAGLAGPATAYWLHRYGFDVTVVERASATRGGRYPIDIRGTALGVVERMGLLPQLRAAHIDTRRITFLDPDGGPIAAVRPDALTGGTEGRDLEVRRGNLTDIIYSTVRDDVEVRFDDSVVALREHERGVDVDFRGGARRTFDLVIGADGLHSKIRSLLFGPEEQFHRYLGYCLAMLAHTYLAVTAAISPKSIGSELISLTLGEIRRLLAHVITHRPDRTAIWQWSTWRRWHQYRARKAHYQRRRRLYNQVRLEY
ncbi:FAD-dependent monooxygenase [Nocardia sp. NPDC004568]|uniref:FAD-dependent monooxygenase n=1 Tax=Nocardia sp. NPDC004568 TaxID=3154551 RepID=UPI0033BE77AC